MTEELNTDRCPHCGKRVDIAGYEPGDTWDCEHCEGGIIMAVDRGLEEL